MKLFSKWALLSCALLLMLLSIPSCNKWNSSPFSDLNDPIENLKPDEVLPYYADIAELPKIQYPEDFNWKQFDGTTLNFIIENNINANILTRECGNFTKLTGININIRSMDYSTMIEKINMDFLSKTSKYHLVYVDPYQTLNRFSSSLEDLNRYNNDPSMPHIVGGMDDFLSDQKDVLSYFKNRDKLCAIPFDTTTMILFYRKDIFDKYKNKFMERYGFDWTPGSKGFTWERYYIVSQWISDNVPDEEVKYGSGQMAQLHNSIFCEFSNIMASYGADYYYDDSVSGLGVQAPKKVGVMDQRFVNALKMYKMISSITSPESVNRDWYDTAEAFKNGEIAMMTNWDENSAAIENASISKVAGKVGYSILPYGDVRSANIYGGSGIGINNAATETEKKAAWLFIVWATSPQTQLMIYEADEGGNVPPRQSVLSVIAKTPGQELEDVSKPFDSVIRAWEKTNVYYRPKISNFYHVEKIITSLLHDMVTNDRDAEEVAQKMYDQLNALAQ